MDDQESNGETSAELSFSRFRTALEEETGMLGGDRESTATDDCETCVGTLGALRKHSLPSQVHSCLIKLTQKDVHRSRYR